jgi:hypothetical protein
MHPVPMKYIRLERVNDFAYPLRFCHHSKGIVIFVRLIRGSRADDTDFVLAFDSVNFRLYVRFRQLRIFI